MKNYVRPKKSLGQHFLTDLNVASRIADTVDACPDIPILEVGPGTGVLTQFLLPKGRAFKAVELDEESVAYLTQHGLLADDQIIAEDFLKTDLHLVFRNSPFVLTGNYPYNISSQIFFKVVDNKDIIPCCTGMIQREVAQRLAAKPGGKDYGVLTIFIQMWYDIQYLFTVDENVFNPPPKVKSGVVCLLRNQRRAMPCDEKLFRRIVKTVFTMRRKMVRNGLKQIHPLCTTLDSELLQKRPEQLSIDDFIDLTNQISALLHV